MILVDRRGLGLSDPLNGDGRLSLDEEVADLDAVLDAAGADRVVVQSYAAGGPLAAAATAALEAEPGADLSHLVREALDEEVLQCP